MTSGLQIINDSGTVQIDELWRNYGFKQLQNQSVTADSNGIQVSVTATGTNILIAPRCETLLVAPMQSYQSGTTWTYKFYFRSFYIGETITEDVRFYVFDMLDGAYSNVGLEVFNASGVRTFHSDNPLMKCRAINDCKTSFVGNSGRIYAPLYTRAPVEAQFITGVGIRLLAHYMNCPANTVSFSKTEGYLISSATAIYSNNGQYAAIDVTGLS
jgi:hypothetical protein